MEMNIFVKQMSDEELRAVVLECEKEMRYRERQFKAKLIDDFKVAFYTLKNNGVSIRYSDYEQEADRIYLDDFDNFEFD